MRGGRLAGLTPGRAYTVDHFEYQEGWECIGAVHLHELGDERGFCAGRFRRVLPCEPWFRKLMRQMLPKAQRRDLVIRTPRHMEGRHD